MKKNVISKVEIKLQKVFEIGKIKIHKARKDFIIRFIISLILVQEVQYVDLAKVFNDNVEQESNVRRIQSFISNYNLSYVQVAVLIASFLPPGKFNLSIDRTNWKFGAKYYNILAVTVYCKGVGVPIYFEMLENKGGNSKQEHRIDILGKIIKIFGKDKINCIIGDREFIGEKWCKWLIDNEIRFYMRIHNDHKIKFKNGEEYRSENLVYEKKKRYLKGVTVFNCIVNVALQKNKKRNKKGEIENLVVITNGSERMALCCYKTRWSIEVFFQSLKGRGFNLEKTHLTKTNRLKKLFAFTCIAFTICLTVGIWKHKNIKAIPVKNHGYKKNSFFKNGLKYWQDAFRFLDQKNKRAKIFDNLLQLIFKFLEANLLKLFEKMDLMLRKKSFVM